MTAEPDRDADAPSDAEPPVLGYAPELPRSRLVWRLLASMSTWATLFITVVGTAFLIGGDVKTVITLGPVLAAVAVVAIVCGVFARCMPVWIMGLLHVTICFGFTAVAYRYHWHLVDARAFYVAMASAWTLAAGVATPFVARACGQF